ncbi:MAG: hypothetical protein P8X55_09065 [Desulfosarcinaceae bacterium]
MGTTNEKDRLKALRQERKAYIERARGSIKESNKITKAIKEQLAAEPRTVPELAAALGMDSAKVMLFLFGLKKYGEVVEGSKDGDYFTYAPAAN